MRRRDFLKASAAAGMAACATPILAKALDDATGTTRSAETTKSSRGIPLAPAPDYPYKICRTYLNAAALGLVARPVRERVQAFSDGMASEGTKFYFQHVNDLENDPREAAARLYGTKAANVGLVTCVSEAISQVAWWLRPPHGKNIVTIDIDIPAVTLPWLRVAQETGLEVRMVQIWSDPGSLSFEKLAALVDKNTAAICICDAQWVTGYRHNLKALAELAHAHGAVLIVDAFHTAGVVPIDVHTSDVDVLVTGGYKWIGAFPGIGACYMRPQLLERFTPILVGAMTNHPKPPYDDVESRVLQYADGAERFQYGSTNHSARISFAAAANYLASIGFDRIESHVHTLGTTLADGLRKIGATVVTPEDPAKRAGIISAAFPARSGPGLAAALEQNDVYVSPRHGLLRFSCAAFNDEEGVDRTLFALRKLV